MNQRQPTRKHFLIGTVSLLLLFFLCKIGFFEPYAYLFSKNHFHRDNLFFRLAFIGVFSLFNHIWFVPRFYGTQRYGFYTGIALLGLVGMLIGPDLFIKQPRLDPSVFQQIESSNQMGLRPKMPIPVPLFEMTNMIVLMSLGVLGSMAWFNYRQKNGKLLVKQGSELPEIPFWGALVREIENTDSEEREHQKAEAIEQNKAKKTQEFKTDAEERHKSQENTSTPTETIETALTVTVNYSLIRIEFDDILFIKSMDNYLQFYFKKGKPLLVRMTFKEAAKRLPTTAFLRVHKSYMVAVGAINSVRNKTIFIKDHEIPIGGAYETAVFKIFGK